MKWSNDQKDWLRQNAPDHKAVELTEKFNEEFNGNRTVAQVRARLSALKIDFIKVVRSTWTPKQVKRLIALCGEGKTASELAEIFDKIPESIRKKCQKLGVQPRLEKHNRFTTEASGTVQVTKFLKASNKDAMEDLESESLRLGKRGFDTWLETNSRGEKALFKNKKRNVPPETQFPV